MGGPLTSELRGGLSLASVTGLKLGLDDSFGVGI